MLDTHIALWAVSEPLRLSKIVRDQICDPANDVWVSIAALWEIAIKRSSARERSDMPRLSAEDAKLAFLDAEFELLAIDSAHVELVEFLPRHHGDPFDRLLVAQAQIDKVILLTHDKTLTLYGDFVMVV